MRIFAFLSLFAFACLSAAAVWMGGVNHDEGWYLYAAQLVSEGKMLYRDFFYTQGPMLPIVYSVFVRIWQSTGILGARILTLAIGALGIVFSVATVRRIVRPESRSAAVWILFLLLGGNLYHLYYITIPKTYALASLFLSIGFFLLSFRSKISFASSLGAGVMLAFAAGTRISLGAILAVIGLHMLLSRDWKNLVGFCIGGFGALGLVYGPFLINPLAREGILAAQAYHTARGGFDPIWTIGSFSRLIRWYLPIFILLGLGVVASRGKMGSPLVRLMLFSFLAVFAVQMLAPFPYEDYQVPIMPLLACVATVLLLSSSSAKEYSNLPILLTLGLAFATSFGSPLLEKWTVNGQDRFWSLKKDQFELPQLREAARRIEALDPKGTQLFTQDVYLAIETGRKVPKGFEMGPYGVISDEEYEQLARDASAPVAALSGYSFAVEMPRGVERPLEKQLRCWELLKKHYTLADRMENFGQNATPLIILKRK